MHSVSGMTEGATSAQDAGLLARVAAALGSAEGGVLSPPQRARLLRLARDIAHTGERQDAPLASYLIGCFVERRRAAGVPEEEAIGEAATLIEGLTAGAAGDAGAGDASTARESGRGGSAPG
jgi:hypothetical protein